ncbi:MAG: hypothetical protein IPN31_08445 [Bacteroidetes bacterium]|nr:hypothetical protein [Bacteroidota bacterium]
MKPSSFSPSPHNPIGMLTPGRNWSAGSEYRFGFNGKESDSETYGEGNAYDYGFRIYNSRLGKFLSVDPLTKLYAYLSSYQFASNTPIMAIDLDGLEAVVVSIRPATSADPALTQVNVSKIVSRAEQPNLTVTYNLYDASGNLLNSTTGTGFVPGSVEAQLATSTSPGVNPLDRIEAGSWITKSGGQRSFSSNAIQDQNAVNDPGTTTSLNGFQYSLNIHYNADGYQLNNKDLASSNTPADVQNQIAMARSTLTSTNIPVVGINGIPGTLDLSVFQNITVIGQTDGAPSNHIAQTTPNSQGNGNPALAQDRANAVASAIGSLNGRAIRTGIVNNSGKSDKANRTVNINITK